MTNSTCRLLQSEKKMRVSKKYLAPSIYSYPYWRLKSNIRFYKGVFCLFGHPLCYYSKIFVPVLIFCPDYLRYVYLKQNRRFDIFLLFLFLNRSASLQQSDPQQYFGGRPVAAARKCPKTKCFRSPTLSVKRKSFWFNLIEKNDFL